LCFDSHQRAPQAPLLMPLHVFLFCTFFFALFFLSSRSSASAADDALLVRAGNGKFTRSMKKQLRAGGRMKRNYFTYYYNFASPRTPVSALPFFIIIIVYYGDGIFGAMVLDDTRSSRAVLKR
jgi:hypothetical protein